MTPTAVVISPHFDDAVLSCWHVLQADVDRRVVTVFAGVPSPGTSGWWDRLTGAGDSAERVRERRREDARALGLAGASSVELDLLDGQYRRNGEALELEHSLAGHLADADSVYAPAGIGWPADHALVRSAVLGLRPDARLYADLPHANMYGWPQWVTGEPGRPELDVDALWRARLEEAGLDP